MVASGDKNKKSSEEDFLLVGLLGLEPRTSCTPCKRASQLRYSPSLFVVGRVYRQMVSSSSDLAYLTALDENARFSTGFLVLKWNYPNNTGVLIHSLNKSPENKGFLPAWDGENQSLWQR
jgi:hypothetical protein